MVKLFSELYNLFQIGYNSLKTNVCACSVFQCAITIYVTYQQVVSFLNSIWCFVHSIRHSNANTKLSTDEQHQK